jgi:hypothetical protein
MKGEAAFCDSLLLEVKTQITKQGKVVMQYFAAYKNSFTFALRAKRMKDKIPSSPGAVLSGVHRFCPFLYYMIW